jgi:hypothetical protein
VEVTTAVPNQDVNSAVLPTPFQKQELPQLDKKPNEINSDP